jgi:hypothetical protein
MLNIRSWARKARLNGVKFFNAKAVRSLKDVDYSINAKYELAYHIEKYAVNGKIGIIWDCMDCDCAQWTVGQVVDATVMGLKHMIESAYDDAEGPISYYFCSPERAKKQKRTSRDLALEAFENGHPWSITY